MAGDASVLWIILPLVICCVVIALAAAIPLLVRRYCRECWLPSATEGTCCRSFTFCLETADNTTCCRCSCQPLEEEDYPPRRTASDQWNHQLPNNQQQRFIDTASPQVRLADA